jgi:hypothetical protein
MKKKITAVTALSLVLAILLSVSGFAASATKTEALLDKVSNSKQISVTMTAGDTALGSSTDTYYINGDAAAFDYNSGFFTVRVVLRDGTAYAYFPILPFFYAKLDNTGLIKMDVSAIIKNAVGLTKGITHFEKSYEEELDGKKYYVEQFNDGAQVKLKFYYDGDELKLLSVYDAKTKSTQNTYFENISFTVDDKVTAVPTGIDISPLLKTIIIALIGSMFV